jgi:hypothetical protein
MKASPYIRNIALDIVLTLLLCGLWNMVVQFEQCKALNELLHTEKYIYWKICIYVALTCGIYMFFFEYNKSQDFMRLTGKNDTSDPVLAVVLTFVGLHWIYDAILQSKINQHFESIVPLEVKS